MAGAGLVLASATKLQATAGAEDPAAFDFENSEEWGAISLALRLGDGKYLVPTSKFNAIETTGDVTIQDGASVDGIDITAANVILADVVNLADVTIDGDLEIQTAGTYSFSNVTVTGDVTNTDGTGNVTINASDGSSLTTTEPGTGNGLVNILNSVTVTVTAVDAVTKAAITGARAYIEAAAGGDLTTGEEILNALTTSGVAELTTFNYTSNQPIIGWVRKGTTSPLYKENAFSGTITADGFATLRSMVSDE